MAKAPCCAKTKTRERPASMSDETQAAMEAGTAPDFLAGDPATMTERALELLQTGGPVVAILLVMSVIALTIVILKIWQFGSVRLGERRTAREALRLYRAGRSDEALALMADARSPVVQALAQAIRGQRRGVDESMVREEVLRFGRDVLESLRAGFRPLEVIASLAPLLGLFGTVLGMIEAFRQLEQAGSQVNPAILSGGIWEALLTTAVGLAVAIPVVVLLNWLERRVDSLAHEMDSVVTQVFTEDLSGSLAVPLSGYRNEGEQHGSDRLPSAAAAGR